MTATAAPREYPGAAVAFSHLSRRPLILAVLLGAGAWASLSLWDPPRSPGYAHGANAPGTVVGRVAGHPVGRAGGDAFPLRVEWVRLGAGASRLSGGRVWVFRSAPEVPLAWGDRVSLWGLLAPVGEEGEISGRMFVPEGKSALLRRASMASPFRWASALRLIFHRAFHRTLSPIAADLMAGVSLGDRPPGLSRFASDFRRSGTYHLLVASGSNVGFALAVWWLAARWVLWWPRRWALAAAPFWAFLYALVAGADAPVLRAAIMSSTIILSGLAGRWDRLEQPLFLSAGLILLAKPAALFQAGFQMSYAATLGIAVAWNFVTSRGQPFSPSPQRGGGVGRGGALMPDAHPPSSEWVRRLWKGSASRTMWGGKTVHLAARWGLGLFLTSFAAQAALAPLLLFYFQRFSWVGIFSNMVAVPLTGLCLALGVGLAALDGLWPWAAEVWSFPTEWAARSLAGWAGFCARWPGAEIHGALKAGEVIFIYAGLVATMFFFHRSRRAGVLATAAWAGTALLLFFPRPSRPAAVITWESGRKGGVLVRTGAELTFFDRGGGDRFLPQGLSVTRVSPFLEAGQGSSEEATTGAWARDGRRWTENGVRWEILRPGEANGFAVRLEAEGASAFLAFGLTSGQQAALLRRGLPGADLLGWTSGGGGPPTDELLAALGPRWIVYPGGRVPRSVRRAARGAGLFRPSGGGLVWSASDAPSAPRLAERKNW